MMSTFEVGDRVLATPPSNSEAEQGTGTVIAVSLIDYNPWPVTVRLDSGIEEVFAAAELEHVDEEQIGDMVMSKFQVEDRVRVTKAEPTAYSTATGSVAEVHVYDSPRYYAYSVVLDNGITQWFLESQLERIEAHMSLDEFLYGHDAPSGAEEFEPISAHMSLDEFLYGTTAPNDEESGHIDSLDEFQRRTRDTAVYPDQGSFGGAMYAAMALNEEAGEVAGKVAKFIRKSSGWDELLAYGNDSDFGNEFYPEELVLAVSKELGDVLYQAARVAEEFGLNLSDVATENIDRLADRKKRDVIIGEGDNR